MKSISCSFAGVAAFNSLFENYLHFECDMSLMGFGPVAACDQARPSARHSVGTACTDKLSALVTDAACQRLGESNMIPVGVVNHQRFDGHARSPVTGCHAVLGEMRRLFFEIG